MPLEIIRDERLPTEKQRSKCKRLLRRSSNFCNLEGFQITLEVAGHHSLEKNMKRLIVINIILFFFCCRVKMIW